MLAVYSHPPDNRSVGSLHLTHSLPSDSKDTSDSIPIFFHRHKCFHSHPPSTFVSINPRTPPLPFPSYSLTCMLPSCNKTDIKRETNKGVVGELAQKTHTQTQITPFRLADRQQKGGESKLTAQLSNRNYNVPSSLPLPPLP